MSKTSSRVARTFISSTFQDFGEERDLLVRKVFPTLRSRLADRFVELVDVDLRWGITIDQAENGEVLPICLAEIDRSRPFFVGLLGERYGWIPPQEAYPLRVLEAQPWITEHCGGKSVTELEILHGVLNDPEMAGRALFYFRSAEYAEAKGGNYLASSEEDKHRLSELKDRIRASGFPVIEDYADPEALADRLEADLWQVLDETFPALEVPDAFERETLRHEAYATPRRALYLGGEGYIAALDKALASGIQQILIGGQSGGGKSALIANWAKARSQSDDDVVLHLHYLRASADASDPVALVGRLVEAIRRTTGIEEKPPEDPEELLASLPQWLANAGSWATLNDRRFVFVMDALNSLTTQKHLRWFPSFLPDRVHMVVSCLPGAVLDNLKKKGEWEHIEIKPLDRGKAEELFVTYLRQFNKELPQDLVSRVMEHTLVENPLFTRTLGEELRLFGEHERLSERLDYYLGCQTVDDLFERVLERVEEDNGTDVTSRLMTALWASRSGLAEEEILAHADLKPAEWAYIRNALGGALLEGSDRIAFEHDYLRIAVSDRYLAGNNELEDEGQSGEALELRSQAHANLARWFEAEGERAGTVTPRLAEEVPYQWQQARDWPSLKACLMRRDMFEAVHENCEPQELLSYWLVLEAEAGADIEADYEAAWEAWAPDETQEATGALAASLGEFLSEAGRYKTFRERLARLTLAIDEKALGPDHPDTGDSLNNLAVLLYNKGDYDAAELLFRRVLAINEKALGPDHPELATTLNNLAALLDEKADYDAAEPLYRQALAIREKCN